MIAEKCQGCAYLDPIMFHCGKYLRGIETAMYLFPFCRANENEEMKKVSEMEMAYGEYLEKA